MIGYGAGITSGATLRHPLERLDVVEISPSVLHADAVFAAYNHAALRDPRVKIHEDDGLSFVRTTPGRYDVVISEPSNPWMSGVGNLFTVEFFESVRDRLSPGGVFTCWFHTYSQTDASVALVLRSLARVFPYVTVFADDDFGNPIALASNTPLRPDSAAMEGRFAEPAVAEDLARLGIRNLASLLTHHRIAPERIRRFADAGPVNTLLHERLEYGAPCSFFSGEDSFLLEGIDPLVRGEPPSGELLLDQYLAWRASVGRPLAAEEIEGAARYARSMGGYGERVAAAVRARLARRGAPPTP